MSNLEPDASLQVPIYLENDFDVDDDGISYLVTSLFVGDEEEAQEVRIPLDDVVESLTEFYGDVEGFRHLYLVAHELSRQTLDLLRPRRAEHDRLPIRARRTGDFSNLRLEPEVQHPVRFIEH